MHTIRAHTPGLVLLAALPCVAMAPHGLASPAPHVQDDTGQDRESLEEYLKRLRRAREERLTNLAEPVEAAHAELLQLAREKRYRQAVKRRAVLVALGPDCAPLLVSRVDPGPDSSQADQFVAQQVALALGELGAPAVSEDLLAIVAKGSKDGRANALTALERTHEPEQVVPELGALFRSSKGSRRKALLATLARIGGPSAEALFAEALRDSDAEVVGLALTSLGEARNASVANEVRALALSPVAGRHVHALLQYYGNLPEIVNDEHLMALVQLAGRSALDSRESLAIFTALRRMPIDPSSAVKRTVEKLVENANSSQVREAGRVYLARHGDKSARRNLLKSYDEVVKNNKEWADAFLQRGEVYYRIADYSHAIRDFKQVLKIGRSKSELDAFVGLARCYALMRRFKEAGDYLDDAPIAMPVLQGLAEDPDFLEMAAHPNFRKHFHLPE